MAERQPSLFSATYYSSTQEPFQFNGSIQQALQSLSSHSQQEQLGMEDIALACAATEGIIDYHTDHPTNNSLIDIRTKAAELLQTLYQRDLHAVDLALSLQAQLPSALSQHHVSQQLTEIKWIASDPRRTETTVRELRRLTHDQPALVIPIAKAGLLAGFDLAHEYARQTGTESTVWPVRISVHRRVTEGLPADKTPVLTTEMEQHLRTIAQGRVVIVFDELFRFGMTRELARKAFAQSQLFTPATEVYNVSNLYLQDEPYLPFGTTKDIVQ